MKKAKRNKQKEVLNEFDDHQVPSVRFSRRLRRRRHERGRRYHWLAWPVAEPAR